MADRARHDHSGEHGWDVRADRARAVGLFRYALIREAADPALVHPAAGPAGPRLAAAEHTGPFGQPVRVSRATLDRWIRDWRRGGFDALVPDPPGRAAHPGRRARAGGRVEAGGARADRGAGRGDPARPLPGGHRTSGPCNATSSAWSSTPARTGSRRRRSAGSRPTRRTSGGPATRCTAPPRRPQGATCSRSSTTTAGLLTGLSVGPPRGHRAAGSRAARRPRCPR